MQVLDFSKYRTEEMMLNQIQIQILLGMMWKVWCAPPGFILIQEQKIWQEAQTYCRQKHLDLATVQSDEDRSMIQEAADDVNFDSVAWIGLYDGPSTWHWSIDHHPISFQMWESWEPDRGRTQEACAFLTSMGRWGDMACNPQKCFLCFNENTLLKIHLIKIRLSWRDARQYCRRYHTDLVTITDTLMNTVLANLIFGIFEWDAWIGLSKNTWLWSDRTVVSLSLMRWIDTQPNNLDGRESCGYVHADGAIADDMCSVPHPFFCTQISKQQTLRVAVRADDNLTDFTVMTAVEEKINQILSEKAMGSGSNLTLRMYSEKIIEEETTEPCDNITPFL